MVEGTVLQTSCHLEAGMEKLRCRELKAILQHYPANNW